MAASTGFVSFPIFRDMAAKNALDDSLGYFHCRLATAKFFDIETLAQTLAVAIYKTRKESKVRDLTLVDGTTKKKSEKNADGTAEAAKVLQDISIKGSKSVVLRTGKQSTNGNYKTVSFRFPGFATNGVISDALGTIIPAGKLKADPTAADAFPYFISEGGRRYPIITKAESDADNTTVVPTTKQQADQLLAKINAQNEAKEANS